MSGDWWGGLVRTHRELAIVFLYSVYLYGYVIFVAYGFEVYWSPTEGYGYLPSPVKYCLPIAKAGGRSLSFSLAFLYLSFLRSTTDFLRQFKYLSAVVAFDKFLPSFHILIVYTSFLSLAAHVAGHACDYVSGEFAWNGNFCFGFYENSNEENIVGNHRPTVCLLTTGVIMTVCFLVIVILSFAYICRSRGEEVSKVHTEGWWNWLWTSFVKFVYFCTDCCRRRKKSEGQNERWWRFYFIAHWTLVPVFLILLCIHPSSDGSSNVAIVFIVLFILFVLDMLFRYKWGTRSARILYKAKDGPTLLGTRIEGEGDDCYVVLVLQLTEPVWFKPGQYMLLHSRTLDTCSTVWGFGREFHPFSIASEPGSETVTFIIKADGDWTGKLKAVVHREERLVFTAAGPFGTPAQLQEGFETLVLIASGVGVTPMLSIYKDLARKRDAREPVQSTRYNNEGRTIPFGFFFNFPISFPLLFLVFLELLGSLLNSIYTLFDFESIVYDEVILGLDIAVSGLATVISLVRLLQLLKLQFWFSDGIIVWIGVGFLLGITLIAPACALQLVSYNEGAVITLYALLGVCGFFVLVWFVTFLFIKWKYGMGIAIETKYGVDIAIETLALLLLIVSVILPAYALQLVIDNGDRSTLKDLYLALSVLGFAVAIVSFVRTFHYIASYSKLNAHGGRTSHIYVAVTASFTAAKLFAEMLGDIAVPTSDCVTICCSDPRACAEAVYGIPPAGEAIGIVTLDNYERVDTVPDGRRFSNVNIFRREHIAVKVLKTDLRNIIRRSEDLPIKEVGIFYCGKDVVYTTLESCITGLQREDNVRISLAKENF